MRIFRQSSANIGASDGTHVSPGFVHENPLSTPRHSLSEDHARVRTACISPTTGLERLVAEGPETWKLIKRTCDRRDLGHPCRGCGAPFTQVGDPVLIWKAATVMKRFHPDCAERFHSLETQDASLSYTTVDSRVSASVDSYADAWRRSQLSERAVKLAAERQAARLAIERWPRYPTAGMLWRAGTLALQQERKDAEGIAVWQRQIKALQDFTKDSGGLALLVAEDVSVECAICLGSLMGNPHENEELTQDSDVLMLPCNRRHAFHMQCLKPWLQRNFQCPKCRADLRPLLDVRVSKAVAESIRRFHRNSAARPNQAHVRRSHQTHVRRRATVE